MKRPPSHRRRGMTLVHVLTAITLLSAFMVAATQLLRATLRVSRDAGETSGLSLRFDNAAGQFRRDVWGAVQLQAPNDRTAHLEAPDGAATTWTIDDAGAFVRTRSVDDRPERQEWPDVAKGMTFAIDGPALLLVEPSNEGGAGRRIPFVSQVAIAREARP